VVYPNEHDEQQMLRLAHRGVTPVTLDDVQPVATLDDIREARATVDAVSVSDDVMAYVVALVRRTRELPSASLGASPRAAVHLLATPRAAACLSGRTFVVPDDVATVAPAVLRHRIQLRPEAELERYTADKAGEAALRAVAVPR